MSRTRALAGSRWIATATAVGLLAGCASPTQQSAGRAPRTAAASAVAKSMSPGMTMPDGSVMGKRSAAAPSAGGRSPSAPAAMVCSADFRRDLADALAVTSVPAGVRTFQNSLLTCNYFLFAGHLVLTVKDLPNRSATNAYFAARRRSLAGAHPIDGLTPGAFGNGTSVVVLRKDNHVLTVDTAAMPAAFGSQHNKRADFAYEVASIVLGCWTGE